MPDAQPIRRAEYAPFSSAGVELGVFAPDRCQGLAYGGGTGVAKDIEVYAHYGHEGGVDYQVDWQLIGSWNASQTRADHRP
jgi:hypothetical protein